MYIQGCIILKEWEITPDELLEANKRKYIVPWNRVDNRPMTEHELCELSDNISLGFSLSRKVDLLDATQKAFYKVEDAKKVFNFSKKSYRDPRLEVKSKQDIEALQIALMKLERLSRADMASSLWPEKEYVNGNAVHQLITNRLKRARKIIEEAISSAQKQA